MKNLLKSIFCLALLISFASCGSDGDDDGLEGTWTAVEFSASVSSDSQIAGQPFTSMTDVTGSNLNYDLTLDGSNFTTSGGYDVTTTSSIAGIPTTTTSESYSDVSGSGTYSATETVMTINGSFFSFDVNGVPFEAGSEAQNSNYEINAAGELVFSQNETLEIDTGLGGVVSTMLVSRSRWVKK